MQWFKDKIACVAQEWDNRIVLPLTLPFCAAKDLSDKEAFVPVVY